MVSCPTTRKTGGFTLIELLVVIAIIGILAGILFPLYSSARRSAKYVVCSSNTRQLTHAILLYAQDYGNQGVPLVGLGTDCWSSDVTASPLWRYLKNGDVSGDVTCCPEDESIDSGGRHRRWSITINGFLFATWFCFAGGQTYYGTEGVSYDVYAQPSRLPAWVCENTDTSLGETVNDTDFANEDITSTRHNGNCAVTYLDGHSGRLKGRLKWNTAKWPDGVYIFRPTNAR
jgi:prepilin-type N-terminal cleavage/methylation domain-containing protein/prepilin-type processing-associated H-X9-DG protein